MVTKWVVAMALSYHVDLHCTSKKTSSKYSGNGAEAVDQKAGFSHRQTRDPSPGSKNLQNRLEYQQKQGFYHENIDGFRGKTTG